MVFLHVNRIGEDIIKNRILSHLLRRALGADGAEEGGA
jgi:hypothetical protein